MQIVLFHGTIWVQGIFQFGTPQNAVWDVVKLNFTTSQTILLPNIPSD